MALKMLKVDDVKLISEDSPLMLHNGVIDLFQFASDCDREQ